MNDEPTDAKETTDVKETKPHYTVKLKTWLPIIAYVLMILYYLPSFFTTYIAPYWTLLIILPFYYTCVAPIKELISKKLYSFSPGYLAMYTVITCTSVGVTFRNIDYYIEHKNVIYVLLAIENGVAALLAATICFLSLVSMREFIQMSLRLQRGNAYATKHLLRILQMSLQLNMMTEKDDASNQRLKTCVDELRLLADATGNYDEIYKALLEANAPPAAPKTEGASTNTNILPAPKP